jgi:hypothetical protein
VPAALVGVALSSRRGRPLLAAALGALVTAWLAAAFSPLSAWLADGLVRRDVLQKADAVVILGSRLQADGEPTTDAYNRLVRLELLAGLGPATGRHRSSRRVARRPQRRAMARSAGVGRLSVGPSHPRRGGRGGGLCQREVGSLVLARCTRAERSPRRKAVFFVLASDGSTTKNLTVL